MAPDTQNPEPGTRNPERGTRNPEPGTGLFEIVDAFVDGRRVNTPELKQALAEAEGRDYFVDAWLLRESLQEQMALESIPQTRSGSRSTRGWLLPVAAAVALLIGGGVAGYRLADLVAETPGVAPPARVIPAAPASTSPAFPVPAPTRAIPVEFTADDSSASGGD